MVKHHTVFLTMFKQMMVGVFGPGMERTLSRVSPQTSTVEVGETSAAQPARDARFECSARDTEQHILISYSLISRATWGLPAAPRCWTVAR
jgi:hypothetical protein